MNRSSLKFKVGIYLVVVLTVIVLVFSALMVRNSREQLLEQTISHAAQLSEALIKSTRFAMLENKPSFIDRIVEDVGAHEEINKVRILSKNGTIIHSSHTAEIGTQVDQEAESCLGCHLDEQTRRESPMTGRPLRAFARPGTCRRIISRSTRQALCRPLTTSGRRIRKRGSPDI